MSDNQLITNNRSCYLGNKHCKIFLGGNFNPMKA